VEYSGIDSSWAPVGQPSKRQVLLGHQWHRYHLHRHTGELQFTLQPCCHVFWDRFCFAPCSSCIWNPKPFIGFRMLMTVMTTSVWCYDRNSRPTTTVSFSTVARGRTLAGCPEATASNFQCIQSAVDMRENLEPNSSCRGLQVLHPPGL
jgi:hypothetical protein